LDEEKMDDDEKHCDKREDRYVKSIEAGQGLSRHVDAAPQKGFNETADERQITRTACCYLHCGKSPFIPEEKVSAETEENGDTEENEPGDPEKLPWFSI
jgi:hypothetical protein